MPPKSCRRPNIGDAMILIVGAGLAMAITKQVDARPSSFVVGQPTFTLFGSNALLPTLWIETLVSPWLVTMAGALLVLRYRQPRPSLRRTWQQPGALASTLGILALLFVGLVSLGRLAYIMVILLAGSYLDPISNPTMSLADVLGEATSYGGTLILGSWLTLALSGRFRREPGWIDGFGIVVGSCWIAAHLVSWVLYRIIN